MEARKETKREDKFRYDERTRILKIDTRVEYDNGDTADLSETLDEKKIIETVNNIRHNVQQLRTQMERAQGRINGMKDEIKKNDLKPIELTEEEKKIKEINEKLYKKHLHDEKMGEIQALEESVTNQLDAVKTKNQFINDIKAHAKNIDWQKHIKPLK